ncbi:cation:dicarboxylate symporter family transporter [Bordetella sp. H567]|uniref:cation:dicarboxylate symporter family transporter n=1 Tax=Bordetella sp. H567 TaxID=1697043 RepID=UPI0009F624DB|nr:cation:dicarboxylase symporter family transporter [Bordetella sp. H567]
MKTLKKLYVQVLIAIAVAIVFGLLDPRGAVQMRPLGEGFIALLKMMLGPIIFCTVVHGIGHIKDFRKLGRLGIKTLVYFEVVSTIAMLVGFTVVNVLRPGDGLHAAALDAAAGHTAGVLKAASADFTLTHFLLSIIPHTLVSAFVSGDILPVLFVSLLAGTALSLTARPDWVALRLIGEAQTVVFKMLGFIMRLSPLGAFGAMAAAVGSYGGTTLLYLVRYILTYYASALIFVFVILGLVAGLAGLSIFRILALIKDEAVIAMGTAASEAAFPRLVSKLSQAGCDEAVVGFVLPAGYSFNIDGACLYMACGIGFIAQATDTPLPLSQQLALLAVMLVTSKGGAGAAGGALVKLTATLQSTRALPLSGIGLLFGIDRILAIATSTTNVIGNSVAVLVLSKWEGMFDREKFNACLRNPAAPDAARHEDAGPGAIPPAAPGWHAETSPDARGQGATR